jgi:hypothetical protein
MSDQCITRNTCPFISLFVPNYCEEDVYALSHTSSISLKHVFAPNALWTQRIHGSNVDNKFYEEKPGFKEVTSMLLSKNNDDEI